MGVHCKIYCGCGAFPAADPTISAARPRSDTRLCFDTRGRDRKTTDILHARLATVSLRAFDRETGSFTLAATPCDDSGIALDSDAEPVTVVFLPSEHIGARPAGLLDFEELLRSATRGALFTFAGRWVTHSWLSRSGEIRESREFEATRMAEGSHDRSALCGPLADGPQACPALAARQLMEAHLPATARPDPTARKAPAAPSCAAHSPDLHAHPFPRHTVRAPADSLAGHLLAQRHRSPA